MKYLPGIDNLLNRLIEALITMLETLMISNPAEVWGSILVLALLVLGVVAMVFISIVFLMVVPPLYVYRVLAFIKDQVNSFKSWRQKRKAIK